jgi:hypothetical protein
MRVRFPARDLGGSVSRPPLVRLDQRFGDADLARVEVEAVAAQPRQLSEPHLRAGGQQHQGAVPRGQPARDVEDDRKGNDRLLVGVFLA